MGVIVINPYVFQRLITFSKVGEVTQNKAVSGVSSITLPATATAGRLIILFDKAINTSGVPTTVIPTGFTQIDVGALGVRKHVVSYKIADASDPNRVINGMVGTSSDRKLVYVFAGSEAITMIEILSLLTEQTNGVPTNKVITSGSALKPCIVLGFYSQQATATQSMSPSEDGFITPETVNYIRYKIYNSSPVNVTLAEGDGGDDNYICGLYIVAS